jgi:hypothetical protein
MTGKNITRRRDLKKRGITYTAQYLKALEKAGKFPRSFGAGDKPNSERIYFTDELDQWVENVAAASRAREERTDDTDEANNADAVP